VLLHVPSSQVVQILLVTSVLYVPILQFEHWPAPDMYVPAGHDAEQAPALSLLYGVSALQFVQSTAASKLYVPALQSVHVPTPVVVLYVPAPQGVHATPSDKASYPARQVQDVFVVLPTAEKVLAGHGEQVSNIVAVVVVTVKVFAAHGVHVAEPLADFQVPTPQGVHAVPSAPVYPARQVQKALFAFEKVLFGHVVQFVDASDE
jgi:hypothetical protein